MHILKKLITCGLIIGLTSCRAHYPVQHPEAPLVPPISRPMPQNGVTLVLGGGGARGLAHVGVLEVFEREGIPIDSIVGASAGGIIGALYADSLDASTVLSQVMHLTRDDLLDPSLSGLLRSSVTLTGPIEGLHLEKFLKTALKSRDFAQLKLPLAVVATSLDDNAIRVLRSGPIVPAVHASAALPTLFTPVNLYGCLLVDGGVIAPVPVKLARSFKPKLVIAVDISAPPPTTQLNNGFDVLYRTLFLSYNELSRLQADEADVVIRPNLLNFGTFEEGHNNELLQAGREEAEAMMPQIKRLLIKKGIALRPKATAGSKRAASTAH